jgi:hypothetical protein
VRLQRLADAGHGWPVHERRQCREPRQQLIQLEDHHTVLVKRARDAHVPDEAQDGTGDDTRRCGVRNGPHKASLLDDARELVVLAPRACAKPALIDDNPR